VPELSGPTTDVHESFLAAMDEFMAEGRGSDDDNTMIGAEIRGWATTWRGFDFFARYVQELRAQALEETPRPPGYVPSTTLWWVDGDRYLGRIAIRHRLTDGLRHKGGHIGYDVRPSARRRGHATAMLRAALQVARDLGIDRALLTTDPDNKASQRVIRNAGGEPDGERGGVSYFWLPTLTPRG
jgi:predicted acetyltransferase